MADLIDIVTDKSFIRLLNSTTKYHIVKKLSVIIQSSSVTDGKSRRQKYKVNK